MIVVDASVLAVALGDDGPDGVGARAALGGQSLTAPELVDLEVLSVWRRQVAGGAMTKARAKLAVQDLTVMPVRRVGHRVLMQRCWELRNAVTVYDAAYVALAEVLGISLLTADARLSRVPGLRCRVELVS